ncbi:MAG: nucleotidyltransferase family protein [Syntrophales bacterium LBB04]|nr:nucleotidyltransferase family protein [Syntrophales bacterium LBB04]
MKAIILAGGMGTRLRGVIEDIPKPMAPVGGRPFLEYLLLQLPRWQITDCVLSVGYKKDVIKAYFGSGSPFGVQISYSEESEPLGTGGALKKAMSMNDDHSFIVMNGDSFFNINFSDLVAAHTGNPGIATMSLAFVKDRGRYGGVEINDDGCIMDFNKEGADTPGLINGGVYLVNRDIIPYIPDGLVSLEGHVLPLIKKAHLLYGKIFDGFFLDMGIPEDYFFIKNHPEKLG